MSIPPGDDPSPSHSSTPNNLPLSLTSFIGREQEIVRLRDLLVATRLLTLTGPGGVGKSRLGLQVAADLLDEFKHGVWLVELASLSNPQLLTQQVVSTLGLRANTTSSNLAILRKFLGNKNVLLALDNCEHLVAACAELAEQLLQDCPRLSILATSREAFGIHGETVWPVSPLSLPDLHPPPTLESLSESEAGQLFIARVRTVQPEFRVTKPTARAIARVCHQLDGIPLAIELAATRVKVLSVPQIAARLDDRFSFLIGGSRTALPRHQTLQAAIDWSYNLLTEPEQHLFRCLAVFAGGFTLEAAEQVVGSELSQDAGSPDTVLDLLSNLVDKSLIVVRQGQEARYRMLGTIRQYARGKLLAWGEMDQIRSHHLAYYLQLAEAAALKLRGEDQLTWINRLDYEQDNFRAALDWALESEAMEAGARLAGALGIYWNRRGDLSEGRAWLARFLDDRRIDDLTRAKALLEAADLARLQNHHSHALELVDQSLALYRRYGDNQGTARSLYLSGVIAHWLGERDRGETLLQESLSLFREIADDPNVIDTLLFLGDIRLRKGGSESAAELWREALRLARELNDQWGIGWALSALGEVARREGKSNEAVSYFRKALKITQEPIFRVEIPYTLEALAMTVAEVGHSELAARLWGAAEAFRQAIDAPLPPSYTDDYAHYKEALKAALGEEGFSTAWAEGQRLPFEEVIDLAMTVPERETSPPTDTAKKPPFDLTPRELEVLRLVATGITDAQVAEELVISPRTAGKHLQSIYSKLSLSSRTEATRFAIDHDLL